MMAVGVLACWCTWSPGDGRAHEEHAEAYDYPDHEPSAEWNVPEPVDDSLPERHWGFS